MKRILSLFLAVLALVATIAVAAPGPVQTPAIPDGYVALGPRLALTAQADTVWTTTLQKGVDEDFDGETAFPGPWLNPAKMRLYKSDGTEPLTKPAGFSVWSSGRFSYQGFAGGDSISVLAVYCDSTSVNDIPRMPNRALAHILSALDTLRVRSFISTDTVFVQPLAIKPD